MFSTQNKASATWFSSTFREPRATVHVHAVLYQVKDPTEFTGPESYVHQMVKVTLVTLFLPSLSVINPFKIYVFLV